MDVLDRADLPLHSLPEFQRDEAACAAYLEKARWGDGFACPHCGTAGEPFHFENRPGLRIDQNMPLLALDQLAGIEAVAVDASPPFSALFTL